MLFFILCLAVVEENIYANIMTIRWPHLHKFVQREGSGGRVRSSRIGLPDKGGDLCVPHRVIQAEEKGDEHCQVDTKIVTTKRRK